MRENKRRKSETVEFSAANFMQIELSVTDRLSGYYHANFVIKYSSSLPWSYFKVCRLLSRENKENTNNRIINVASVRLDVTLVCSRWRIVMKAFVL